MFNGDVTSSVVVTGTVNTSALNTYTLTYTVSDSTGNSTSLTRSVIVRDTTPPVITLNGSSSIQLLYGNAYNELGATASDNYDQSLTVVVGGDTVDPNTLGTYTITYNVTDTSGIAATQKTRTVTVVDNVAPVISLNPFTETVGNFIFEASSNTWNYNTTTA